MALGHQAAIRTPPFPAQTLNNSETLHVTSGERARDLDPGVSPVCCDFLSLLRAQHCLFET